MIENALTTAASFEAYQGDPVGFCESTFGEIYTDDVKAMMESVRDNPVTVAKSANATGKTHGAARVAAWFIKCFPDAQVYTAAAPPEDNLRRLLWDSPATTDVATVDVRLQEFGARPWQRELLIPLMLTQLC